MITSIFNDDTKKVPKNFHNNGIKTVLKRFHLMAYRFLRKKKFLS